MKSTFINVLVFAAGAAIGSAVTWKVVQAKYEQIVQEELESIREAFGDRPDEQESAEEGSDDESDARPTGESKQINWDELEDLDEEELDDIAKEDISDYARLASNYTNEKGGAENVAKDPYIISPYEFGEIDEYHRVELTYYADGTLEDEDQNIVTDVEDLIGPKALFTFGEYEDDAVFVRNERLQADFQILKDYQTYKEARSIGPDQVDD